MTAIQKQLGAMLLVLSCGAAAQIAAPATVESVTTSRDGADLLVEITLSAPVKPSVETAENPHWILLDFPQTTCTNDTRNISVNKNGVRRVRTARHSTNPLITRV